MSKLSVPKHDFTSQLKEGHSYTENKIGLLAQRAFDLAENIKKSYGALGSKIMVISRHGRIHVTGNSHKFFQEIETSGPDTKIIVDALKIQHEESGDACKFFLILVSELIKQINMLLGDGITKNEILNVYDDILKLIPSLCDKLIVKELKDLLNKEEILPLINNVVRSNVVINSEFLSGLIYDACLKAMYPGENKSKPVDFGVESVKVCKISGGSMKESYFVSGLVLDGRPEGQVHLKENTKVAIYTCGFDYNRTEGTSTILFKSAEELSNFSKDEEDFVESFVRKLSEAGVGVVISSGKSNDLLIHFANKYNIMVIKVSSKFMIRRISVCLDAKMNVTMQVPSQEFLGTVDKMEFKEINEQDFVSIERKDSMISTIVLFGTTEQLVGMAENAISSGVNLLKVLSRNPKLVAGTGAFELSLGKLIREHGEKNFSGDIKSYIYTAVASAFESIPKILIENSGIIDPDETIAKVLKLHLAGKPKAGAVVVNEGIVEVFEDVTSENILDAIYPKLWAVTYAFGAIEQMCRVTSIIMARSADFKPKSKANWDDDGQI